MDIEAFLAAQLWLRRLSPDAWPLPDPDAQGSGGVVILAQAKCCFLLEDRPSAAPQPPRVSRSSSGGSPRSGHTSGGGARGDSGSARSRQRPRLLWFSTGSPPPAAPAVETNAGRYTRVARGHPAAPLSDSRSSEAAPNDRRSSNPHAVMEKGSDSLLGGRPSLFQRDNSGTVRARGRDGLKASGRSTATAPAAAEEAEEEEEEEEETDAVPLTREFDFGLAISRPREDGRTGPSDNGGRRPPAGERGGTLLLRIGGTVFQAEHTLIRSIAYPRGGGGGGSRGPGSNDGGRNKSATKGGSDEGSDANRGGESGAGGRGKSPPPPVRGIGLPPLRPPSTAPAGAAVTGTKRALDASAAADGAGGIADVGRGRSRCSRGGRPAEGVGKRGRFEDEGGVAGTGGRGGERATDAAATAPRARRSDDGEDGVDEGMPFCGIFFPGVLLKFWLPQQKGKTAGTRADAVARMQGVVSNMMAGLSPNPRYDCPPGGGRVARPELDAEICAVVMEGKENGFRPRCEAWDEFVYGSRVLLRQERAFVPRQRGAVDHAVGGPSGSRACARCSDVVGIDEPVLSGESARGGPGHREDEGPSDVGRARALTCLAECFSEASMPSTVKLSAQRLLRDAATSAGRELEGALERAFPLDLSQGTDASTRVAVVSELEASLRRVQAAREAALTLALLPASETLDELGDSA